MPEERENGIGQVVQMAEENVRDQREPASEKNVPRVRQERPRWQPQSARMPNGDPPSLILWGTDES
jgi:hypothetical protein